MNLNTTDGYVYAIHAIGTNRVKIGFSQEPDARLDQLQVGSSFPLELLCVRRGNIGAEQRIHRLYKDKRVTGEWFVFEPAEIEGLKRGRLLAGRLLGQGIQIPELIEEIPELLDLGDEISTDIFSDQRRLWRIETYVDRHGKRRARRILRFVTRPPKIELGQVGEKFGRELKARPGRGRWRGSRIEAHELRRIALDLAERFRRDPGLRRRGKILRQPKGINNPVAARPALQGSHDDSQWGDVPPLLM